MGRELRRRLGHPDRRETMPKGTTKKQADEELRIKVKQVLKGSHLPEKRVPLFKEVAKDRIE